LGGGSGGKSSPGGSGAGGGVGTGGATATGGSTGNPATGGAGVKTGGASGTGGVVASGGRGGGPGSGGAASGGTTGLGGAGTGGTGTGGSPGTGGGTTLPATGGSSGATRLGGACQSGATYPAPVLTGTPKLLYKPSGASTSGTFEGPVWLASESVLLLSDISFTGSVNPSQMLKLTPPSTVATFLADAGTNGMAIDGNGVVLGCSHKVQGIVKLDFAAATLTTVVDSVGGKTFNSPNDLVVRSDGTIYFTDPDYQLGNRTSGTGKKGIYRVTPTGTVSVVDDTFNQPNGISLSPDEKVLYVADYAGNAIRTFAVAADGSTSGRKDFVQVSSPDGFGMDCLGNLYVASGGNAGALQVFAPSGTKLGSVTVAASLSNAAFGGSDGKTLYLTAGKALYSLDMNLPGYYY
jgi:gluconolactonase